MRPLKIRGIFTAENYFDRLAGLMFRTKWPSTHRGVLFPRCSSVHCFFTFLKPDILFLDKNFKILKIFASARSWRLFFGPPGSRHCLELPQGTAWRFRLKVKGTIRLE